MNERFFGESVVQHGRAKPNPPLDRIRIATELVGCHISRNQKLEQIPRSQKEEYVESKAEFLCPLKALPGAGKVAREVLCALLPAGRAARIRARQS